LALTVSLSCRCCPSPSYIYLSDLVVEPFHPWPPADRAGRHFQLPQPVIPFDASITISCWYRDNSGGDTGPREGKSVAEKTLLLDFLQVDKLKPSSPAMAIDLSRDWRIEVIKNVGSSPEVNLDLGMLTDQLVCSVNFSARSIMHDLGTFPHKDDQDVFFQLTAFFSTSLETQQQRLRMRSVHSPTPVAVMHRLRLYLLKGADLSLVHSTCADSKAWT
jgi:hypothetical protein